MSNNSIIIISSDDESDENNKIKRSNKLIQNFKGIIINIIK